MEDFRFDWHSGEIAAYLLAGQLAASLGELAVLYSEDVEVLTTAHLITCEDVQNRFKPESEGLRGFLRAVGEFAADDQPLRASSQSRAGFGLEATDRQRVRRPRESTSHCSTPVLSHS